MTSERSRLRADARRIVDAAIAAVRPEPLVESTLASGHLERLTTGRFLLVACGKAARPMAGAIARACGSRVVRALVAGPPAAVALPEPWETLAPAHPLPDAVSVEAGTRALELAGQARASATLVLLSGGASAMLCAPAGDITLDDKRAATDVLMRAGAPIHELNCVRKHLSRIKGGQLALCAGRMLTLAISDVHWPVENDPSVIGGGPTVGDPTSFADALAIAERTSGMPGSVLERLRRGAAGEIEETPAPDDPRLRGAAFAAIGSRRTALDGAAAEAARLGYEAVIIDRVTHGEARDEGREFASHAVGLMRAAGRPLCVLAAGEPTVRVVGRGRGGRNQEFVLAAARELAGLDAPLLAASAGTDGRDGPTDAAGAVADVTTMARAAARGLDAAAALADNDAYPFFAALDDLIISGPTGTNVGDLHLLLAVPVVANAAGPWSDTHP